jgi:homoserine kinase type II
MITLTPWLAGLPPQGDNLEQAHVAGRSLAELGKALAEIQIEPTVNVVAFPLSGDFEAWGRIDLDTVRSLMRQLPLSQQEQSQIITLLERTRAATPSVYQTAPVQIVHRDYDQSNILMEGTSVTGILDFEFCGPDLRILDLAYALLQWHSGWWNTGREWDIMSAFVQGYLSAQPLPLEELELLPLVFRLRITASLFYRVGRYARRLETTESLLNHVQQALHFERWLEVHEGELLHQIRIWYTKQA